MNEKTNNAGTMGRDEAVECPECGRKWPWESEQAVAVGLQGACIACTMKYPDGTHEESQRRYSLIAALRDGEAKQPAPHQPAAVFRNNGNTEADFIAHEANACTACGGSGHKADQQPTPKPDAVAGLVEKVRELRAFADEARDTYRGSHASGTFRAIVRQIDELAAALATQHQEPPHDHQG